VTTAISAIERTGSWKMEIRGNSKAELPDAFSATLGRVLPVSGKEGVALLLTAVFELMSAFGFAGLRLLANAKAMDPRTLASCRWPCRREPLRQRARDPSLGNGRLPSPRPPCLLFCRGEGGCVPTL